MDGNNITALSIGNQPSMNQFLKNMSYSSIEEGGLNYMSILLNEVKASNNNIELITPIQFLAIVLAIVTLIIVVCYCYHYIQKDEESSSSDDGGSVYNIYERCAYTGKSDLTSPLLGEGSASPPHPLLKFTS